METLIRNPPSVLESDVKQPEQINEQKPKNNEQIETEIPPGMNPGMSTIQARRGQPHRTSRTTSKIKKRGTHPWKSKSEPQETNYIANPYLNIELSIELI